MFFKRVNTADCEPAPPSGDAVIVVASEATTATDGAALDPVRTRRKRVKAGRKGESRSTLASGGRTARASAKDVVAEAWSRSRTGLMIVGVLTLFINVLKLAVPLYIFQLLDRVVASRSVDTLLLLTAITTFAVVVGAGVEYVRRWMLVRWGNWIEDRFGRRLFLASLGRNRAKGPGQALTDLGELRQFASSSGATAWLDVWFAPAFVLVVYLIHPLLALVVVAGMALMIGLGFVSESLNRRSRDEARAAKEASRDWLAAADRNPEAVAALNVSGQVAGRWSRAARARLDENLSTRLRVIAIADSMRFVESATRIGCYGLGVWLVLMGALSVGGVIAAAVLGRIGSSEIRRAMASWRDLTLARAAYERVRRRLSRGQQKTRAIRDRRKPMRLVLDTVTLKHKGETRAVIRDLGLELEPGEVLAVIGASGTGKSSLVRMIAGVQQPTSGAIRLGELDIARYGSDERAGMLGYLEQHVTLFAATIAENLAGLGRANEKRLVESAKLAGLHDTIMAWPKGYETAIDPAASNLSAGERRRIGLARAFHGRPRLIVLDEPEANVDEKIVRRISRSITAARDRGAIVVVTAQSGTFVPVASKVLVLSQTSRSRLFESAAAYETFRAERAVKKSLDLPAGEAA